MNILNMIRQHIEHNTTCGSAMNILNMLEQVVMIDHVKRVIASGDALHLLNKMLQMMLLRTCYH